MSEITIRRPICWKSHAASDVGSVRSVNEDAVLEKPEIGLWAVADGMGGHEAGDVASAMIVHALENIPRQSRLSDLVDRIEDSLIDVNSRLLEYAEIMLDGQTVGSTIAGLAINGQAAACIWAGDSRLYRYRNAQLQQISRDHSEVAELLECGAITRAEAHDHPDANVITRAIGTSEELYVDIDVLSARIGDRFLLCSDGLYNAVSDEQVIAAMAHEEPEVIVSELIDAALQGGAPDNVSAVLIKGVPGTVTGEHRDGESVQLDGRG
jgi:serine/threonine protein phosphatase PrpC